jgi:hypothetical protein
MLELLAASVLGWCNGLGCGKALGVEEEVFSKVAWLNTVFEGKVALAEFEMVGAEDASRPIVEAASTSVVNAENPVGNTTLPIPLPTDGDSTVNWGTFDCCTDGVGDGIVSGR